MQISVIFGKIFDIVKPSENCCAPIFADHGNWLKLLTNSRSNSAQCFAFDNQSLVGPNLYCVFHFSFFFRRLITFAYVYVAVIVIAPIYPSLLRPTQLQECDLVYILSVR